MEALVHNFKRWMHDIGKKQPGYFPASFLPGLAVDFEFGGRLGYSDSWGNNVSRQAVIKLFIRQSLDQHLLAKAHRPER